MDQVSRRVAEGIRACVGMDLQDSRGTIAILRRKVAAQKRDALNASNPMRVLNVPSIGSLIQNPSSK